MKKLIQKITTAIMVVMMGFGMVAPALQTVPAYADGVKDKYGESQRAAILTGCADEEGTEEGNGKGIMCVVKLVVNIMSVLVGVVGIIGIVIVGIQYLTAGGNEDQTRKAKRRLFEIIIGLVAYAFIYAIAQWILPTLG